MAFVVEDEASLPEAMIEAAILQYKNEVESTNAYCVPTEDLYKFLGENARPLYHYVSDNYGYGHCHTDNICQVSYQDVEFFVMFGYNGGSCSFCDSDASVSDKIDDANPEKAMEIAVKDLEDKLRSGLIYGTRAALVKSLMFNQDLKDKLTTSFPDEVQKIDTLIADEQNLDGFEDILDKLDKLNT